MNAKQSRVKYLRISAIMAVLLLLGCFPLFRRAFRTQCDHSDIVPHGLVQYRSEISLDKVNPASAAILQLAFAHQLIGTNASSIASHLAAADDVAVVHDSVYSPTDDVYTFVLPCLHIDAGNDTELKLFVTVSRSCHHVVDVVLDVVGPNF